MAKMDPNKRCLGTDCGRTLSYFNKTGFCTDHNPQRWKVHRERRNEYFREWNRKNSRSVKNTKLKKKYGITIDEYERKLAEQGGVCAVCNHPRRNNKSLVVDHHHESGRVRDLLCSNCNQALGLVYESVERLEALIRYVKKHNG